MQLTKTQYFEGKQVSLLKLISNNSIYMYFKNPVTKSANDAIQAHKK